MRKQNFWKAAAVAAVLMAGAGVFVKCPVSYAAEAVETGTAAEALPGTTTAAVNGTDISFQTYSINGNTYFRLRDLAKAFMGTSKSISITEDAVNQKVELKSNEYYTASGNEPGSVPNTAAATATADSRALSYDGSPVVNSAWDINGEMYFTLEDLQSMMNFTISTDEASGEERISTGLPWTPVTSIDFSAQKDVMIKNSDGTLVSMAEPYYTSKLVAPGTWQIQSDGDYMYLVEGDDEAILIDSGYGAGNIRAYCETLTSKPLRYVINTHYHFDHTANDAYFDCAYMSADTAAMATIPYPSFAGINFPRDYPVEIISDGYTFDLGNRTLEVLEIPNHTAGGTALLDRTNRILFSGDEIMRADSISLNCSVEQFNRNMEKLEAVRDSFDQCFGGPGIVDAAAIDHFFACSQYILQGGASDTASAGSGQGGSGQWNHDQNSTSSSGQTVYTRGSVRTPDKGAAADNTYQVKTTYSGCTLMYDSRKLSDETDPAVLFQKGEELKRSGASATGLQYFLQAAEMGYADAETELGDIYMYGHGVTVDYAKAFQWLSAAASSQTEKECTDLGILYLNGWGTTADYQKALELLTAATDLNSMKAPRYVGLIYENGYGTDVNYGMAAQYYQTAADRGDITGTYYLGQLYEKGLGVDQDYEKAMELYLKSAERGDIIAAPAMTAVGHLYQAGLGVEQDRAQAEEWYEKAAATGYEAAKTALESISAC